MSETPVNPNHDSPMSTPPKKSSVRKLIVLAALLVAAALLLPVINLFSAHPTNTPLTRFAVADSDHYKAAALLERSCVDCHSTGGTLPLYARLPVASSLIQQDMAAGLRDMDMFEALVAPEGKPVSEVALAKLEYALADGDMPPARYVVMHWDRGFSDSERQTVLKWVRDVRKAHYASPGVAARFEADVLQPLPESITADDRKVALGDKLYHDVRLSGDDTLSCASCHALDKGGTDQARSSTGIRGQIGPINSPTVYNSVFNVKQFWDGRAENLSDQAAGPVANPIEMGSNFEEAIGKLQKDAALTAEFKAIYPAGWTKENICDAIAEFESTLVTPGSRFDQYLAGKADALNAEELAGLELFRSSGCTGCHVGKNLGGQSFERMGRRVDYFAERGNLTEADNGRFNVTRKEADKHCFKVPTLRNVARTFPYFHDGSQSTLEGAVKSMAKYQTERSYSDQEAARVARFLETLTGTYKGKPL